jgi:prepilin-type processing-associated H-X9-DG protein
MTTLCYPLNTKDIWTPRLSWMNADDCVTTIASPNKRAYAVGMTSTNNPVQSAHADGVLMLFADGHVGFVDERIPTAELDRLCRRADRQPVDTYTN